VTDDIRDDALSLLSDALVWRLPVDRWQAVDQVLGRLTTALAGGHEVIVEVLHDLEVAGADRVVPLEEAEKLPAPQPVRERISRLVHTLDDTAPAPEPAD
jgi:hypothetical protein